MQWLDASELNVRFVLVQNLFGELSLAAMIDRPYLKLRLALQQAGLERAGNGAFIAPLNGDHQAAGAKAAAILGAFHGGALGSKTTWAEHAFDYAFPKAAQAPEFYGSQEWVTLSEAFTSAFPDISEELSLVPENNGSTRNPAQSDGGADAEATPGGNPEEGSDRSIGRVGPEPGSRAGEDSAATERGPVQGAGPGRAAEDLRQSSEGGANGDPQPDRGSGSNDVERSFRSEGPRLTRRLSTPGRAQTLGIDIAPTAELLPPPSPADVQATSPEVVVPAIPAAPLIAPLSNGDADDLGAAPPRPEPLAPSAAGQQGLTEVEQGPGAAGSPLEQATESASAEPVIAIPAEAPIDDAPAAEEVASSEAQRDPVMDAAPVAAPSTSAQPALPEAVVSKANESSDNPDAAERPDGAQIAEAPAVAGEALSVVDDPATPENAVASSSDDSSASAVGNEPDVGEAVEPLDGASADLAAEDLPVTEAEPEASPQDEADRQVARLEHIGRLRGELRKSPPFAGLPEPKRVLNNQQRAELLADESHARLFLAMAADSAQGVPEEIDPALYAEMSYWAPSRVGYSGPHNRYPEELLAAFYNWSVRLRQGDAALSEEEAMETGRRVVDYASLDVDSRNAIRIMLESDYTAHVTPTFAKSLWAALEHRGIQSGSILLPNSGGGALSRSRPLGDSPERFSVTQIPNSFMGERIATALSPEDCVLKGPLNTNVLPSNHFDAAMATLLDDRALPSRGVISDESVDWEADAPAFSEAGHMMYRMSQAVKPGAPVILACRGSSWGTSSWGIESNLQKLLRTLDMSAPLPTSCELVYGESPENPRSNWTEPALIFVATKRESLRPVHECAQLAAALRGEINAAALTRQTPLIADETLHGPAALILATQDVDDPDSAREVMRVARDSSRVLDALTQAAASHLQPELNERLPAAGENRAIAPLLAPAPRLLRSERAEGVYQVAEDGVVSYRLAGALEAVVGAPLELDRLRALVNLRELTLEALNYQLSSDDDIGLARRQRDLLQAHTGFVETFGWLSANDNRAAFQDDAFSQNVLRLEVPLDGDSGFERSDFFRRRVVKRFSVTDSAETVDEAIQVCLGRTGRIEPRMMEQLLPDRPWSDIRDELGARIFRDPLVGSYTTAEQYLSGPVRAKLKSAMNAALVDPEAFAINVKELSRVQPVEKSPGDITIDFGASWVPVADKEAFLRELFGIAEAERHNLSVTYEAPTSTYTASIAEGMLPAEVIATWQALKPVEDPLPGQPAAAPEPLFTLTKLVGDTLNNRTTKIYRDIPETVDENGVTVPARKLIDVGQTTISSGYQDRLRDRWKAWCTSNPLRASRLLSLYNTKINAFRKRECTGDYLRFEGLSPHWVPLSQQRAAIARYVEDGNILIAHGLGKGKTFSLAGAAIEGAALGVHSKVVMTCPTAVIAGHAASITEAYPSARILVAQGLSKRNRKAIDTFVSRASMQDWDLILMSYESVEAVGLGLHAQRSVYQRRLDETRKDSARDPGGTPSRVQSGLIKKIQRLTNQIEQQEADRSIRPGIESIGADAFFIDEVHNFRNIPLNSKTNVLGITSGGAARSITMDLIIDHVRMFNGRDRGHASATGTPICNSIAELYTMSRLANPSALRAMGIRHFDAWAALFGKIRGAVEARPAGDGYIFRSRFIQFQNIPELSRAFSMVADVRLDDALTDDRHPRPDVESELLVAPATALEAAFMKTLEVRARAMDDGEPLWKGEGAITLMGDLKRGMIDLRLLDARIPVPAGGSIDTVVGHLVQRHAESTDTRGVQFIFLDEGVHAKPGQFSAYDAIKQGLISRGIPEKQIVVATEVPNQTAWLKELRRLNRGDARFLLGSSTKIGIGINAHQRAIGGVHVDIPARPDQLLQRIGRYQRPGNSNTTVQSAYLGRQGVTNDFERLAAKAAAFISALTDPDTAEATHTDGLDVTLESVQVALTNNHTLRRKVELDAEVRVLLGEREQFLSVTGAMTHQLHVKRNRLEVLERKVDSIGNVIAAIQRESDRQDALRAERVAQAEAAEADLEASKAAAKIAGDALRELKDEAAAYRQAHAGPLEPDEAATGNDLSLAESTLLTNEGAPAPQSREGGLRAARVRAATASALAAVELPAELAQRLSAAVDAATSAARKVTNDESTARAAKDASKWYEVTAPDGRLIRSKQRFSDWLIDARFELYDFQPARRGMDAATRADTFLGSLGEEIRFHLLWQPTLSVESMATRKREALALVTTDSATAIDLNGPGQDREYHGMLIAIDIVGERFPFFAGYLESSAANLVMKMVSQISSLSVAAIGDVERLRAETVELSARAAEQYPREAELIEKQQELADANIELLAQRSRISHEEELRIMEPLRGFTTRSGRPLHPDELRAWTAQIMATDGDEAIEQEGEDEAPVGPLAQPQPQPAEAAALGQAGPGAERPPRDATPALRHAP